MPAPKTEPTKSERTRERLLLAAATTLSRLGYAAVRLVDVGEEAGVQAPAMQPLIIGILNWAAVWWSPKRSSIDEVVATAQSIVRHGVAAEGPD